jgi:hypothetical protein
LAPLGGLLGLGLELLLALGLLLPLLFLAALQRQGLEISAHVPAATALTAA